MSGAEIERRSWSVPAARTEACLEVRKSRFIAWLAPATSREEALHWLALARQCYPDARHHCWAYLIGAPESPALVALSDDGEPGGTAGRPILNVIQHKVIGDTMLIVTRYFGGIKLGAGGLVRAYGQAAQKAFEAATLIQCEPRTVLTLACDYASEQWLRHQIGRLDGMVQQQRFGIGVELDIALPLPQLTALQQILAGTACQIVDTSS
jgi:uncharacterized YigZ family protein